MTTFAEERRELLDEVCDEILHQATMTMRKAGCSSEEIEKALVRYAEVVRAMTAPEAEEPTGVRPEKRPSG